jgi:hypothetical protein
VFTVSDNATVLIRQIVSQPGVPQGAGMRISTEGGGLSIGMSAEAQPGDVVYGDGSEARIFVSEGAVNLLEGKTIDATQDDSGRVQFVLGEE